MHSKRNGRTAVEKALPGAGPLGELPDGDKSAEVWEKRDSLKHNRPIKIIILRREGALLWSRRFFWGFATKSPRTGRTSERRNNHSLPAHSFSFLPQGEVFLNTSVFFVAGGGTV